MTLTVEILKPNTTLVIYGTTASNKSMLALDIAKQCNGVIINADSSQVYSEVLILNNSPTLQEKQQVPHKLFNFISVNDSFSVGFWLNLVKNEIEECFKNNQTPIVVGGSGLYISALLNGLSTLPSNTQKKQEAIELYNKIGHNDFLNLVNNIDSNFTKKFTDKQRLIRFYEIFLTTNQSMLEIIKQNPAVQNIKSNFFNIFVKKDRPILLNDISVRFKNMVNKGALDEVKQLKSEYFKKFLGAYELNSFIQNTCSLEQAIQNAITATNQYAKRQNTWFKNQIIFNAEINNYQQNSIFLKKLF